MAWLHLTCHHYCRPTNLGGLYDLRVNISWRHLVIAWKVLASVVLRMPPLLSGTRSPSPSSVPSPLTFSRAIWRHICLISHIHNCDVTFLSYCVFSPSFCLVSVWYHKRFWAWRLVAIENWHYYYHYYYYFITDDISRDSLHNPSLVPYLYKVIDSWTQNKTIWLIMKWIIVFQCCQWKLLIHIRMEKICKQLWMICCIIILIPDFK